MSSSRLSLACLAALIAAASYGALRWAEEPPAVVKDADPGPTRIVLQCQFYVFVESRPFVAFLMERSPGDPPLYRQVYVAKADGDRTDYNTLVEKTPEWRLDRAGDPPRIKARVTVPDQSQAGVGEQDIAIELHDFDAARADGVWREASLKSVHYQNLPGKCRQSEVRAGRQREEG